VAFGKACSGKAAEADGNDDGKPAKLRQTSTAKILAEGKPHGGS
jgi:hypothetical protein